MRQRFPLVGDLQSASRRILSRLAGRPARLEPSREGSPAVAAPSVAGYVDSFRAGWLVGWAWRPDLPTEALPVQVFAGDELIEQGRADLHRADLTAAGIGTGRYGFRIAISPEAIARARAADLKLAVTAGGSPAPLASLGLSETDVALPEALARRLVGLLERARPIASDPGRKDLSARSPLPGRPSFLSLVARSSEREAASALSPYCAYVRARWNVSDQLGLDDPDIEPDAFYRWYLDHYVAQRSPLRAPLGASEIRRLNGAAMLAGRRHPVSRAALWYLVEDEGALAALTHGDHEVGFRRLSYWWACRRAVALNVEDCLVPGYQAAFLQAVGAEWRGETLPLSRFGEEHWAQNVDQLASLGHPWCLATRAAMYFALLILSLETPGQVRFIPRQVVARFLFCDEPLFDAVAIRALGRSATEAAEDRSALIAAYERAGFDLRRMRFASLTSEGHRIEAQQMRHAGAEPVHVQLIAPFGKVSGLAAAGRSSRDALARAGIRTRLVGFALDNPQPSVTGPSAREDAPGDAEIQLIHVNADLLPLVFAYLPDVFSRSYVIGFFFWELDKVSDAQRLALDLVDEIWVASEYNRVCFAQATDKPVVNVGLCLPPGADPDRSAAKAWMCERFGFGEDTFAVCATYDSFSFPQRKNPLGLVRAFRDAFPDDPDARLIIKTHNASVDPDAARSQILRVLLEASDSDHRIVFVDETMDESELRMLVAGVECYASLHRSEGFGLGMLEAMRFGTPVLCSAYGGNLDFCTDQTAWLVECVEVPVKRSEYALVEPGHHWGEPVHASAVSALRAVRRDDAERSRRARNAQAFVSARYGVDAVAERFKDRLDALAARPQARPTLT